MTIHREGHRMLIGLSVIILIINGLLAQFVGDALALRGFVLFAILVMVMYFVLPMVKLWLSKKSMNLNITKENDC